MFSKKLIKDLSNEFNKAGKLVGDIVDIGQILNDDFDNKQ